MDAVGALVCSMGGSFFFNGIALREFPTLSIVTARVGLAALALLFLMKMLGQGIQLNRQILKAFLGMSFLNNVVPFSLIVWGQQHISSGVASILNATTSLLTMFVAHWFTSDEKINPRRLLGVLTGMGGVGLMMGLDSMESSGFHLLGQSAILLAPFSFLRSSFSFLISFFVCNAFPVQILTRRTHFFNSQAFENH